MFKWAPTITAPPLHTVSRPHARHPNTYRPITRTKLRCIKASRGPPAESVNN